MFKITYRFWSPLNKPTVKEFTTIEAGEYWFNYYSNSLDCCCVTQNWR